MYRFQQTTLLQITGAILAISVLLSGAILAASTPDINGDGSVNVGDLGVLVNNYGKTIAQGDLNSDSRVTAYDLSILLSALGANNAPVPANTAGKVNFFYRMDGSSNKYVEGNNATYHSFINAHYAHMEVFSPYFNQFSSWYPKGMVYQDSYSIGVGDTSKLQWTMKTAAGTPVYLPWGCAQANGCPQWAADVGSAGWRTDFINRLKTYNSGGNYSGFWIDDVNMDPSFSDQSGNALTPIDPRTGAPLTADNWRKYMAEFIAQIKATFPDKTIMVNTKWYQGGYTANNTPIFDKNPYVQQLLKATDLVEVEGGIFDEGLQGGGTANTFSVDNLLAYIDRVHALGKHVTLDNFAQDKHGEEYALAGYYLVNDGGDFFGNRVNSVPDDWWTLYDTNLGAATGPRYNWNGLIRRDFTGGMVLLDNPWGPAITKAVDLGGSYKNSAGQTVTNITMDVKTGAILTK